MSPPTEFEDLNGVLEQFVDGASAVLGANLCGAYLLGSFALGEADEHSDVDFIVATDGEVTEHQQSELQGLHSRLFGLEVPWAQHLEGSYAPADELRAINPSRARWLYLDNGASTLVRSDHCNTAVVRWVLRERGETLAGPPAETLVDPVPPDDLRAEALTMIDEYADWAEESRGRYEAGEGLETWTELPFSRWQQPYLVLTMCRLLWTLEHGTVATKRGAAQWALGQIGAEWTELVERALADRADPWGRTRLPSDPELVARTCAFVDYARFQLVRR